MFVLFFKVKCILTVCLYDFNSVSLLKFIHIDVYRSSSFSFISLILDYMNTEIQSVDKIWVISNLGQYEQRCSNRHCTCPWERVWSVPGLCVSSEPPWWWGQLCLQGSLEENARLSSHPRSGGGDSHSLPGAGFLQSGQYRICVVLICISLIFYMIEHISI